MNGPVILWLRRDLRLADQPALTAAVSSGVPVIPVYILDDEGARHRAMGGASRWWLHHSLASLAHDLKACGSRLVLRRGRAEAVLADMAAQTGASAIRALHHYEPWWRNAEAALRKALAKTGGAALHLHHGNYLAPPGSIVSGAGTPYRIYTPFWRALQTHMPPPLPMPAPKHIAAPDHWPASDALTDWHLLPTKPDWAAGFRNEWTPGEAGAAARIEAFARRAARYETARNLPSQEGSSRLSPHLHFGEISPAQVWHGVGATSAQFLGELGWRDYAQNIILQFPDYGAKPAREQFEGLPWREGAQAQADLAAWQQGRTGYPIVDAGMRQLWATGWMHNRVRMIAASFLIKHLLIEWRAGERWFWDTLVDADYGQNAVNWQWSAGSGVDANLFVRIMAPLSQSAKFDAAGYIRQWLPELAHLSDADIHDPPSRPRTYPAKVIGHAEGRARALAAYSAMRGDADS